MLTSKSFGGRPSGRSSDGEPKMKVLIQKNMMIDGKKARVGDEVEVPDRFAKVLINSGRALLVPEKVEPVNRSVGLETSEAPKPTTRRKTTTRKKKPLSDGY